ncbi:MAG: glycosyltransferase family 2 protein [Flavobacterium sp.]
MIVIYHQNNQVSKIDLRGKSIAFSKKNIANNLFEIAVLYPDELIVWCYLDLKSNLNFSGFQNIFHHHKIMASYNPFENSFLSDAIGYVEESPFIKINKKVTYPTWQMSSCVGGVHASVLLALKAEIKASNNLDYFLHSLAKLAMQKGLLCYSEPQLLKNIPHKIQNQEKNTFTLFRFVKQHYKTRWAFLLFLNLFLYERKLPFLPFIFSFFYFKRKLKEEVLDKIEVQSNRKTVQSGTIDVIIPTIGRKQYLYDVLKDLAQQTHLPEKVIIVEQNPLEESVSELDYLENESWPFQIKHIFTHQAGACNARNLALAEVKSELVFMADDDIRIENDFIEKGLLKMNNFGVNVATFGCYAKDYSSNKKHKKNMQWTSFGSGCSIVKNKVLQNIFYNISFEFGYGEDSDFGIQLRNNGADVLFFPNPEIVHLSAPIGGFRTKPELVWQNDSIQPKPSPTVMLYKQLHLTKEQINGYKTILFFKFYKLQKIKNPVMYFFNFKKQWEQSLFWANELIKKQ